jgi:hypothetical protein
MVVIMLSRVLVVAVVILATVGYSSSLRPDPQALSLWEISANDDDNLGRRWDGLSSATYNGDKERLLEEAGKFSESCRYIGNKYGLNSSEYADADIRRSIAFDDFMERFSLDELKKDPLLQSICRYLAPFQD